MRLFLVLALFVFGIWPSQGQGKIGCRNERGDPVDWFIVYKLPRQNVTSDEPRKKGLAYLYMDQSTAGQWKRSNATIDQNRQTVAYTLKQFYANAKNDSVFRLLYNDELPQGNVSYSKGHTKGALVFDGTSGFWMIHSVPKFPPKNDYGYPPTGAKYGQTFFCVTFPYSMLGEVGNQLLLNEPYIYDWSLPAAMARDNEVLQKVIKGQPPKTAPFFRKTSLTSLGGVAMTSFAKHKKWSEELYTDLVAPTLQKVLYTETWQNGGGDIGSNCTAAYKVYNIANLTLETKISFSNHDDHSKWAVSDKVNVSSQSGFWICVGDINRQKTQYTRSGGTMCMQNEDVWKTFRFSIQNYQKCPNKLRRIVFSA